MAIPVLVATGTGWFIGRNLARLTCESNCLGQEVLLGAIGAVVGFIGVLVVAILAVQSLSEWAEVHRRSDREPNGPPEDPS